MACFLHLLTNICMMDHFLWTLNTCCTFFSTKKFESTQISKYCKKSKGSLIYLKSQHHPFLTVISRTKEEFKKEREKKNISILCNCFSHMSSVLHIRGMTARIMLEIKTSSYKLKIHI